MGTVMTAKQGDPEDKQFKELSEAVMSNPSDDRAHNTLGNWFYDRSEYDKAIPCYEKAKAIRPAESVYELNIGDAYRGLSNWDKAIEHYQKVAELDPKSDRANNGLGIAYYFKRDYENAVKYYKRAIQIRPEAIYYVNLGDAFRQMDNLGEAIDYYQEAVLTDAEYAPGHNSLGIVYALRREYKNAIEHFEKAIAIRPSEPVYCVNLADAYRVTGEHDKAIQYYGDALKSNPNDASTLNALGLTYSQKGEYERAIQTYLQALSIEKNPIYLSNLGNAYRISGNTEEAINCYKDALVLDPGDHLSYNSLGVVYSGLGKYNLAIQQYQKAASLSTNPIYYVNSGDSFRALGKLDEAIQNFQMGLKAATEAGSDPTEYQRSLGLAFNDLGVSHYVTGDQEKALQAYRKALEYVPDDDVMWHNVYLALKAQQHFDEAEVHLRKALELNPKDAAYLSELEELNTKKSAL